MQNKEAGEGRHCDDEGVHPLLGKPLEKSAYTFEEKRCNSLAH